MQTSQILG